MPTSCKNILVSTSLWRRMEICACQNPAVLLMWFEWLVLDEKNTKLDFCGKKKVYVWKNLFSASDCHLCADVIGRNFRPVWWKSPHNLHKTVTLLARLTEIYCIRLHCGVQINNIILIIFKQGHHNKWDNNIMLYSFCSSDLKIDWLRFQTVWTAPQNASQINCKV